MDLIKLIFFNASLFLFSYSVLINIILIYLFLNMIYKMKVSYSDNLDTMYVIINLINITMHMIIYKIYNIIDTMNKTFIGNLIISSYNYLDSKITYYKNQLFLFPIRFIINKVFGIPLDNDIINKFNKQSPVIKKTKINTKLETNIEISNFLDEILNKQ
jgi:hypothetical protein